MIDNQTLDELTERLSAALPDGIKLLKQDVEKNFRAVLEHTFSEMRLVSREEFDIQAALLARTREKLKQLEAQLERLEQETNK